MENVKLSDVQLIALYKNGNEEAFAELLNRHSSRVYTSIYLIVKDRYIAEDLLQDVFMKVVRIIKTDRYKEEGKFLPWILRIANNLAIDHFRKKKRYPEITYDDGFSLFDTLQFAENDYESAQVHKETKRNLRLLIKQLPDEQRKVLVMRHYFDMSFQEIADRTDVSINTALGRMRYAILNLRKQLTNHKTAYDKDFYPK
ncbi:MAG: sigma-70 family RNA polymerase sigma factor [Cyclobacteriaceae bacterium]|nr:sigma-70 family RNA polymerase sigma factor [Cyclobacteriaceae bacterium]